MLNPRRASFLSAIAFGVTAALQAQQPVPVRQLGRIVSTAKEPLASIGGIRPLSDGRVLVNDALGHRVVLFDSSLSSFITAADTTSSTAKAYGSAPGAIYPLAGDTSVFADPVSRSFVVIDAGGKIARTIAAPLGPGGGLGYLIQPLFNAHMDGLGNVLYRLPWAARNPQSLVQRLPSDGRAGLVHLTYNDSALIVRANLITKKLDTIAKLNIGGNRAELTPTGANSWAVTLFSNAIPVSDDWTLMPDGTLAIVRVSDYHIDWLAPNGTRTASPKIAHVWDRYTDSAKTAILDSSTTADSIRDETNYAVAVASAKKAGQPVPDRNQFGPPRPGMTLPPQSLTLDNGTILTATLTNGGYGDASFLSDYRPPFVPTNDSTGTSAVRTDAEGRLWIRIFQMKPAPGGPIFDIVDRQGVLVDRIQIPGGTSIVGFAPGVVYLTSRGGSGYSLVRARIR